MSNYDKGFSDGFNTAKRRHGPHFGCEGDDTPEYAQGVADGSAAYHAQRTEASEVQRLKVAIREIKKEAELYTGNAYKGDQLLKIRGICIGVLAGEDRGQ